MEGQALGLLEFGLSFAVLIFLIWQFRATRKTLAETRARKAREAATRDDSGET